MEEGYKRDVLIHHLMAACGGFIGVYAIVSRWVFLARRRRPI